MTDRIHSFTLGDIVRENSRTLPTMEAVVCGDHRLTYVDLEDRVNRLAQVLTGFGIEPGDRIAWLGTNCHRLLELIYAAAKVGAITAPLNWRLSPQEITGIIEDLRPKVVIASADGEFEGARAAADAVLGSSASWLTYDDGSFDAALDAAEAKDPELDGDDEAPVLALMTAAFGGKPKGALLTSRGIVQQDLLLAAVGQIRPAHEVYLSSGPMFHIGVLLKTFAILHWGGKVVMIPKVDAEEICRLVEAERCTSAFVFGPTIRQMVELNADGRYDLTSMDDSVGGVPPGDIAELWYKMTSCSPPRARGVVGYGTTETVGMVTYEDRLPYGEGVFGRSSPAMAVRIFDPEGNELPAGEIGEIAVRGPQVMFGYLGHDDLDPNGWRWMGDLGRREPDGSISFLGPNNGLIKTGMENVYPVEVENVLREHPAVKDACVFGVPDPEWGESIRAAIELDGEVDQPDEDEIIAFVKSRIASYKKPRSVVFCELPRAGGFVDRAAVKATHGHDGSNER